MSEYCFILETPTGTLHIRKTAPKEKQLELLALAEMLIDYYKQQLESVNNGGDGKP